MKDACFGKELGGSFVQGLVDSCRVDKIWRLGVFGDPLIGKSLIHVVLVSGVMLGCVFGMYRWWMLPWIEHRLVAEVSPA